MEENEIICATCKLAIHGNYLMVGDNFLQAKFFDSEEDNRFCSKECLCQALSVLEVDKDDGSAFLI